MSFNVGFAHVQGHCSARERSRSQSPCGSRTVFLFVAPVPWTLLGGMLEATVEALSDVRICFDGSSPPSLRMDFSISLPLARIVNSILQFHREKRCGDVGSESSAAMAADALHKNPGNVAVRGNGCHDPAAPAATNEGTAEIIAAGGENEVMVATPTAQTGDVTVLRPRCLPCVCLARARRDSPQIFAGGGVEAVMGTMRSNPGDVLVQRLGCLNLALNGERGANIHASGGVKLVMDAMKEYPADAAVQNHGCRALAALATFHQPDIIAAGGAELAIQAMHTHPGDVRIQSLACHALAFLACDESSLERIADAGGVGWTIGAMHKHPRNVGVQVHGCRVLCALANINHNKIVAAGGVEVTIKAMRMHPGRVPVEDNGYRVLKALARTEEGRLKILNAGGTEVLRVATCQHPGGPHVNPETWG